MFRTNKIKGRVLAMLSDEDLRHLGVAALGDRKYLLHIFKSYKETAKVYKQTLFLCYCLCFIRVMT